jgi:hypothetical protein
MCNSVISKKQVKSFRADYINEQGENETLIAHVRYDDQCGNGHNTFSITGDIRVKNRWDRGGCIHEDIAKRLPDLAKYIKWHLCNSDGPTGYIPNTIYLAGNKDCWGHAPGEPSDYAYAVRFADSPVSHHIPHSFWTFLKERHGTGDFQVVSIAHEETKTFGCEATPHYSPKYTFVGFAEQWYECPFDSKIEADEFCDGMNHYRVDFVTLATAFSKGKERELDAARRVAIWPEATDEELTVPGLKNRLEARLPALIVEFHQAIEELGFIW